ncbi:MAG: HAMP domain-containing protein [Candidatus Omnitrophica bacterium]|nr:HAMP domain-containing protein [Candidatus Omnitrophota bacterium]
MKIRAKIRIRSFFTFVAAIAVGAVIYVATQEIDQASRIERTAASILKDCADLQMVTHEYLLHHEERAYEQWSMKYDSLSRVLSLVHFKDPEERALFENIKRNQENTKKFFEQIVAAHKESVGFRQVYVDYYGQVEGRLVGQLLIKLESMLSDSFRLHELSNREIGRVQKRTSFFIGIFVIGLALTMAVTSSWVDRSILGPIAELNKGMAVIGAGNLDYKVATKSNDEIGELANTFDYMAENLKRTTTSIEHLNAEIFERRRAEEKLQDALKELKKLDQLKSDFVSTVSHELRTPLAIIKEGIGIVNDGVAGHIAEHQKKVLNTAAKNIDRLTNIINSLLDISKIEAGKIEIRKGFIDLVSLVKGTVAGFKVQAEAKGLKVKSYFEPETKIYAHIDPDKIVQVFTNLIGNAIKFTEKGHIDVSVVEKEDRIECAVTDTGIGIKKQDLTRVFEKFQQFGRVDGAGAKGTGLGLSIARALVEMHDGKIRVESPAQKSLPAGRQGTKFIFTLPRYDKEIVFKEYVSYGLQEAKKKGARLSIIIVGVSHFDKFEKEFSHGGAYALLRQLEEMIDADLRHRGDVVFRTKGELITMLDECAKTDAEIVRDRIKKRLSEYLKRNKLDKKILLSFGVATYPDDAKTDAELIKKARNT